jgi:SAM-dependent methyltransferase
VRAHAGVARAGRERDLYSPDVADLPFLPARPELTDRLIAALDADGKINRALVALGALAGADVAMLGDAPVHVAGLREAGARVAVLPIPADEAPASDDVVGELLPLPGDGVPASDDVVGELLQGRPPASLDAVVSLWSGFAGPSPASLAAADRVLRPGGRLLVLQDYGRDDLDGVRGVERTAQLVRWSRRDGWYLRAGFRIHVVHAFWHAADPGEAGELLEAAFGPAGHAAAAGLRRSRIAHNVAIFHRTRPPA